MPHQRRLLERADNLAGLACKTPPCAIGRRLLLHSASAARNTAGQGELRAARSAHGLDTIPGRHRQIQRQIGVRLPVPVFELSKDYSSLDFIRPIATDNV